MLSDDNSSDDSDSDSYMDLLWEWWVTATQALVDAAGSENALRALRPHYVNANTATMRLLATLFQEISGDPDFIPKISHFAMVTWLGGNATIKTIEGGWEMNLFDCKTKGECKELCQSTCQVVPENSQKTFNQDANVELEKGMFKGDENCLIVLRYVEGPNENTGNVHDILPMIVSQDIRMFIRLQYLGESWVFTTRAFLDTLGSETTLAKLRMYMRHSGLAYGMRAVEKSMEEKKDALFLGRLIGDINNHHMRKGERNASIDLVEQVVFECPFSQAPPEICLQYEAFFRGICEAVNPDYEFSYDRMMSTGDETCHWKICKKGSKNESVSPINNEVQEMLRMLKWKLTKGEITPEVYRELRDTLLEK